MKIGLFGFTFSHENMGCQALTCSFLEMLRRACPNEKIEIVGFRNESTLGKIPELFADMEFKLIRVSFRDPSLPFMKEIKTCDIVFDETFGDGFSDIYFTKSVYRDTLVKCLVSKTKVPFILTPQTYGPFKHKTLEWLAGFAIRNATVTYARDKISANYAEKISKRKVKTVTDLAFMLPFEPLKSQNGKVKFGLNVSGLLWQGGFSQENQFHLLTDYRSYCQQLIQYVLDQGYEVHLIGHVTKSDDSDRVIPDGDYPACIELSKMFPEAILAPCFESPYEVKNYIAGMDIFVGARMHATIAAFSSGVRTIPFAYSRKFQGLYDNLGYPFYVDGTKMKTEEALEKTISFIIRSDDLEEYAEKAMVNVRSNSQIFENELHELLKTISRT